jgi:hypothetical protein
MSKYQTDEAYRNRVKQRNKDFQRCMREDSRRMDWFRVVFEEKEDPDLEFIREIVSGDKYGEELPNGKKRRPDFEYCQEEEVEEEDKGDGK